MADTAIVSNTPFLWEGTDRNGKKIKGKSLAGDEATVRADLRRQGVVPTRIRKQRQGMFSGGGKITTGDIAIFSRQLATMLAAGIPLVQAFESGTILPLTPVRILRGPLWLADAVPAADRADVLRLIKSRFRLGRRELLIWTPELADSAESCGLMRACGMRRMVMASVPPQPKSIPTDASCGYTSSIRLRTKALMSRGKRDE